MGICDIKIEDEILDFSSPIICLHEEPPSAFKQRVIISRNWGVTPATPAVAACTKKHDVLTKNYVIAGGWPRVEPFYRTRLADEDVETIVEPAHSIY